MYADAKTAAIENTLAITHKRREMQEAYNTLHGITPKTVKREIVSLVELENIQNEEKSFAEKPQEYLTLGEVEKKVKLYAQEMKRAAKEMRFEDAAKFRDLMREYQNFELHS
jgi:excinuclease ABC subunit B